MNSIYLFFSLFTVYSANETCFRGRNNSSRPDKSRYHRLSRLTKKKKTKIKKNKNSEIVLVNYFGFRNRFRGAREICPFILSGAAERAIWPPTSQKFDRSQFFRSIVSQITKQNCTRVKQPTFDIVQYLSTLHFSLDNYDAINSDTMLNILACYLTVVIFRSSRQRDSFFNFFFFLL